MIVARNLLLLLALNLACANGAQAEPLPDGPNPQSPPVSQNADREGEIVCQHNNERDCIRRSGGRAVRQKRHLHLTLKNGRRRTFTDVACPIEAENRCLAYRLVAIYPRHGLFLVGAGWGNHDGASLLVSARTGKALVIDDGLPHFSPSGRRLGIVTANQGYNPDGIEIFSLESGEPKSEWRYVTPGGALYRFVAWDGDERLKMTLTIQTSDKGEVEAVRTATGWSLRPEGLDDAALSRFYEKPFPLQTLFDDYDRLGRISYHFLHGFLAGVFTKDPNTARQILAGGKPQYATILISALQIAGMEAEAKEAAARWGLRYSTRGIVPLATLRPGDKVQFHDPTWTLWAATYATGDPTYMRRIYDAYLGMADHAKEVPAIMLAECALLIGGREWDERDEMIASGKYVPPCLFQVYPIVSRLLELDANAREHRFLGEALLSYVKEQPETKGARALLEYARRRSAH